MARETVAFALSLLLAVAPATAAPPGPQPAEGTAESVPQSAPRSFTLALGDPGATSEGFSLGLGRDGDDRYRFDRVELAGVDGSPVLAGLTAWSVGTTFNLGLEGGRPRVLVLGPLQRGWDDLDGWEKFGVVLQTAAAAAAAIHFTGKLVEKLK